MDKLEITKRYNDLDALMSMVKNHSDKLISEFSTGSSEHKKVSDLTASHDVHQQFFQLSSPTDDMGLEELAIDVRTYYKVTNRYITDLGSASSGKPAYAELAKAHSE